MILYKPEYVLGIDPGLNHLGWAIIKKEEDNIYLHSYGYINTTKIKNLALEDSETQIQKISMIINKLKDDIPWNIIEKIIIEEPIVNINPRSSLKLCKVQGAIIGLGVLNKKEVIQLSPSYIKETITGNGSATKETLDLFIKRMLNITEIPNYHVSDAIAIALSGL